MDRRIKMSRKQEQDGARRYGGRVNARSGAGDTRKNDVQTDTESIEFKITEAASYRLKLDDLLQAWCHAVISGRKLIFGVEFGTAAMVRQGPLRYVILPEDDYLGMREELSQLKEDVRDREPVWQDH